MIRSKIGYLLIERFSSQLYFLFFNKLEHGRLELRRPGLSKKEQSRQEQSKMEQSRKERGRLGQSRKEHGKLGQSRKERSRKERSRCCKKECSFVPFLFLCRIPFLCRILFLYLCPCRRSRKTERSRQEPSTI